MRPKRGGRLLAAKAAEATGGVGHVCTFAREAGAGAGASVGLAEGGLQSGSRAAGLWYCLTERVTSENKAWAALC